MPCASGGKALYVIAWMRAGDVRSRSWYAPDDVGVGRRDFLDH